MVGRTFLATAAAALLLSSSSSGTTSAFAPVASSTTTFVPRNHHVGKRQRQPRGVKSSKCRSTVVVMVGDATSPNGSNGNVMALPRGSLVALATPMKDDGATVDLDVLRELLQWHKREGTAGIVILGTTGEASTLTPDERAQVMAVTREEVGGVLPIIVGTGTIDTQATIAATQAAREAGADAALVVTPYYVKPSQSGLLAHFTTIADAVDLPIVLYNVPGRTGVDLSVETTVKLSHHPMIQGLKDATGDNNRVSPMRKIIGDEFRMYSGEDGMARDYVLQGGDGVISVTANVAPGAVANVMRAALANDAATAEAVDAPLAALHRDLFCEANPIPVKWALTKMGRTANGIRLPLTELGESFQDRVSAALSQASCIAGPEEGDGDEVPCLLSYSWPSRSLLLQGHLFDSGLINQALEIIEKRGGDFSIESISVQPNDQLTNAEFNFKRPSSVALKIFAANEEGLDDIVGRLQSLVEVMCSAEGTLTEVPVDEMTAAAASSAVEA